MAKSLREIEGDARITVPPIAGYAIQALADGRATPEQQKIAFGFIVEALCGTDRLSFALPGEDVDWRQGRRFVGLQLRWIVATPIVEEQPAAPPARTATERARRRAKSEE